MRFLLRVDGKKTYYDTKVAIKQVAEIIGASCLDTVRLKDCVHVMCVDDTGMIDQKPINKEATKLYWQKCGYETDNCIHGDVFICPDQDYE